MTQPHSPPLLPTVVVVNDSAFVEGGADEVALSSARGLAHRGHRVLFAHAGERPSGAISELEWVQLDERPWSTARAFWNPTAANRLRACLNGLGPGPMLIHLHRFSRVLSPSVLQVARQSGIPALLTLHDYFLACPNGAFFDFNQNAFCERQPLSTSCLRCGCDQHGWRVKLGRSARLAFAQSRTRSLPPLHLLAVSSTGLADARRLLPSPARLELMPNPVWTGNGTRVEAERQKDFLFVGRFDRAKGPDVFARAVVAAGVPATFVGAGPLEKALRALAPSARWRGWLGRAELETAFSQARALVFPSVFRETFGLVAAEALARGVPVIATAGTAADDFLTEGVNARRFPRGDAGALARLLSELATDDAQVRRLSEGAHARFWAEPPTLERHVTALQALYARLTSPAR